jgi:hypothetical protein
VSERVNQDIPLASLNWFFDENRARTPDGPARIIYCADAS